MKKLLVAALLVAPGVLADSEFSVILQGGAAKYNQSLSSGADLGAVGRGRRAGAARAGPGAGP